MDLGRIYCSLCGFLLALHHNGYFLASLLTFWLVVFVEKEPIRGSGPLNSALISVSHCPVNSRLAFSKIINSSSLTLEKCLLLLPRMRTCLNHLAPPFFFQILGQLFAVSLKCSKMHEFEVTPALFPCKDSMTLFSFIQPGPEVQNSIHQVFK